MEPVRTKPKRSKQSRAWSQNYLRTQGDVMVCIPCEQNKTMQTFKKSVQKGSTGNIIRHFKSFHPDIHSSHQKNSTVVSIAPAKALVQWIISTNQPFNTVENKAFRDLFRACGIEVPILSRITLKSQVEQEYNQVMDTLRIVLQSANTVSISTDAWTNSSNLPFLGIVVHWIDDDFNYQERVLDFARLIGKHSGENMAHVIAKSLKHVGIEDKLFAITGDNAGNNLTLASEIEKLIPQFTKDHFVRCLAHVINLCVQTILVQLRSGTIKDAEDYNKNISVDSTSPILKVRALSILIGNSPQQLDYWKFICNQTQKPANQIQYDVANRWNSTYYMIDRGCDYEEQYNLFVENDLKRQHLKMSSPEWLYLNKVRRVLAKFEELTKNVSEGQPQISQSLAIYYEIDDHFNSILEKSNGFDDMDDDIIDAVRSGYVHFQKYYNLADCNDTYFVASVLDPRMKTLLLQTHLADAAEDVIQEVKRIIKTTYSAQQPQQTQVATNNVISRMLRNVPRAAIRCDVDNYFDGPLVDDYVGFDVIKWWKDHRQEYPIMAQAARDYLAIPNSSVDCERMFSRGVDVSGVRRHSLHATTFRMLMMLK
ncbi:hypothetical protein AKO1_000739, partial [Acrasis kona]